LSSASVGVIGLGIVGGATFRAFRAVDEQTLGYDVKSHLSNASLQQVLRQDLILIAVPTPVSEAGEIDLTAVESVFERARSEKCIGLLILRSTVPVGTTTGLIAKHKNLRIGYSPEFLHARSPDADFVNPFLNVVGCQEQENAELYLRNMKRVSNPRTTLIMHESEAELLKLFLNGLSAVKSCYVSEMGLLARSMGLSWNNIREAAEADPRLGIGYNEAFGPDGLRGFGGTCLPKDSRMLARLLTGIGLPDSMVEAALRSNRRLRADS
jgi:UDPglucose 6-dehydrogenase